MNKVFIPVALIIAGIIIGGAVYYTIKNDENGNNGTSPQVLTTQEVGDKVIAFINDSILQGRSTASLIEVVEENELYRLKIDIEGQEIEPYATRDGKLLFPEAIDLEGFQGSAEETGITIGSFSVSSDEVCKENGKPIIYFFGSNTCPFCTWEHPIMEKVAAKFGNEIAFHNNMDSENDMEVFEKYSTGGIPTLVFGCKYYRVGAGKNDGEELETKNLTALICKLTGSKPGNVCSEVQDLIDQIQ